MKNRSKLMLLATSLLTVSIAASATSAFAWYTAARSAKITTTNIAVTSKGASLKVDFVSGTGVTKEGANTGSASETPLTLKGSQTLTDISSDGTITSGALNAVKPRIGADGNTVDGWYNSAWIQQHILQFKLKFTNTAELGSNNLELFLKGNSKPVDDATLGIDECLRYSICNTTTAPNANEALLMYANPMGAVEEAIYLANETATKLPGTTAEVPAVGETKVATNDVGSLFNGAGDIEYATFEGNETVAKGYLLQIAPTKSVELTFSVWVEGTDEQCTLAGHSAYASAIISMPLNFYAVETAPAVQEPQI